VLKQKRPRPSLNASAASSGEYPEGSLREMPGNRDHRALVSFGGLEVLVHLAHVAITRATDSWPHISVHFLMQRECLLFHEHLPHCKDIRIVDAEHVNCDAADGGSSDEFCSCPREMVAPSVLAWVEKPDEFAGGRIVSGGTSRSPNGTPGHCNTPPRIAKRPATPKSFFGLHRYSEMRRSKECVGPYRARFRKAPWPRL
jgi:hypothetical protein